MAVLGSGIVETEPKSNGFKDEKKEHKGEEKVYGPLLVEE
jgi:hypothetical protein